MIQALIPKKIKIFYQIQTLQAMQIEGNFSQRD